MEHFLFDSWMSVLRIVLITTAAYASLILLLRVSGKRTLSKMNAFDFIVTVALGSSMATVALTKSIPLLDGVVAFAMLIGLQALITWLSVHHPWVRRAITSQPTILLYRGQVNQKAMKRERITTEELLAAARKKGVKRLEDIAVVVLETTGDLIVIEGWDKPDTAQTLSNVGRYEEA